MLRSRDSRPVSGDELFCRRFFKGNCQPNQFMAIAQAVSKYIRCRMGSNVLWQVKQARYGSRLASSHSIVNLVKEIFLVPSRSNKQPIEPSGNDVRQL